MGVDVALPGGIDDQVVRFDSGSEASTSCNALAMAPQRDERQLMVDAIGEAVAVVAARGLAAEAVDASELQASACGERPACDAIMSFITSNVLSISQIADDDKSNMQSVSQIVNDDGSDSLMRFEDCE